MAGANAIRSNPRCQCRLAARFSGTARCAALAPLLLLLPSPARAAPRTAENEAYNVNVETGSDPSAFRGQWEDHAYFASPADWRALPVYQLITDRFADGDPLNNERMYKGFEVRDMASRHGGDFRGITEKLDYIKGLGCYVIWISPIFQNGHNSYHQYAQHDFTLLDERLGTVAELRQLTSEAHRRGMYVIVDIVVNHMADKLAFEGSEGGGAKWKLHDEQEYRLVPRCLEATCPPAESRPQPYQDFHFNNTWDKEGKYTSKYKCYDHNGKGHDDPGSGTYTWSDFHHNGDLQYYRDALGVVTGKIYGIMDDLRTENERVQQKLIAMSQALIASTDVDGFRIDTPMQVDLGFFKAWAPAVKGYAAEKLGKRNFGMWGEFFVRLGRYATMTGRGKSNAMYGKDEFIDNVFTLNGGIEYPYYDCLRPLFLKPVKDFVVKVGGMGSIWQGVGSLCVSKDKDDPQSLIDFYKSQKDYLDFHNKQTQQEENTMWHFCNNHDQWRLQAMVKHDGSAKSVDGTVLLKACLVWLSLWPGVPVHYAGDEQGFATPGTALDGWAREELALSAAWRGLRGPPAKDNFDMTSPMYLYVQKLNRIRSAHYARMLSCDKLWGFDFKVDGGPKKKIFAWARGCHAPEESMLVVERLHHSSEAMRVQVSSPWPAGTRVKDLLSSGTYEVGDKKTIKFDIPSYGAVILVRAVDADAAPLGPVVVHVEPAHDAVYEQLTLHFRFDRKVTNSQVKNISVDGQNLPSQDSQWCLEGSGCSEFTAQMQPGLAPGIHQLALHLDGGVFRSRFRVPRSGDTTSPEKGVDAVMHPLQHWDPELVAADRQSLLHSTIGATHWRARNVDNFPWSDWQPLAAPASTPWVSRPGVPVMAQYYAEGSSSYFVGGCRNDAGEPCDASFYSSMTMRGAEAEWENKVSMALTKPFTWAGTLDVPGRFRGVFFVPFDDGSVKFGTVMHMEVQKAMMVGQEDVKVWPSDTRTSVASAAEYASTLQVNGCCHMLLLQVPWWKPWMLPPDWGNPEGVCWRKGAICTVLLNDMTMELRVEVVKLGHWAPPWWFWSMLVASLAFLAFLAWYLVRRCKRGRSDGDRGDTLKEARCIEMATSSPAPGGDAGQPLTEGRTGEPSSH